MRFLYKLVIGMFLFSGIIIALAVFIPNATMHENAENVTTDYGDISLTNIMVKIMLNPWGVTFFLFLMGLGAFGVLSGKNTPLYFGLSIIIGFVVNLFTGTVGFFITELDQYPVVNVLFNILLIGIGIIALFSIGEVLAGRSESN